MEVLQVKHLQKVFFPGTENERHVLKNINLQVTAGDFISVIGNNGAGKIDPVKYHCRNPTC